MLRPEIEGLRCIYSPFMSAATTQDLEAPAEIEMAAFALAHAALIPDLELYSPRRGLTRQDTMQPLLRAEREVAARLARTMPALSYTGQHASELMARRIVERAPETEVADISVLTTVYSRTDPDLFRATAASLLAQTLPFRQWVILAHGAIVTGTGRYSCRTGTKSAYLYPERAV